MIVGGGIVGFFVSNLMSHNPDKQYEENAEDIRKEESNDGTSEELLESILIPCFDTMFFVANQTEQEVNFYNPEKNKGCDFQLTLTLDDGTELWKSQHIQSGKAIYNITLNKALEAGTYKAQLQYNCSTTDGTPLNGSRLDFNLIVKE